MEAPDFGRWSEKGLPHKDWVYVDVSDLGEVASQCEMCGTAIRYVHFISHPLFPEMLGVGCICAEHLTSDSVTPRLREKNYKKREARKETFLKKEWRETQKGYSLKYKGLLLVVYQMGTGNHPDWWRPVVSGHIQGSDRKWFCPTIFRHLEAAKVACWDQSIKWIEAA